MPADLEIHPWEPEETVGKLWHAFASRLDAPEEHQVAAVELEEVAGRLAVFFRGLGGPADVEIRAAPLELSRHRLSWRRRLGTEAERRARPSYDGETLRLPPSIADFPERDANAALFFWLAAAAVHAPPARPESDPLRGDLRALRAAEAMTQATLAACPGLARLRESLAALCWTMRPAHRLPPLEAAVEAAVRHLLGGPVPEESTAVEFVALARDPRADLSALRAPAGYRPFSPVPLWPDIAPAPVRARGERPDEMPEPGDAAEGGEATLRARRQASDQAKRQDSLILHRFETILSWAEFLNLNRAVEDDDTANARKAADDLEEITLGQVARRAATRLKLHLDLSPEEAARERLAAVHVYPEWDQRSRTYLPDHCRVLASRAEPAAEPLLRDARASRRIRAVKRRFEALRPRRIAMPRQIDGEELDLEALVAAQADLKASGRGSDRIYRATRAQERDLAVSILLDISRSTESAVGERSVIEVEKEALAALAWGLAACGDDSAIHAFSSLRRDRVYLLGCKDFSEPMSAAVEARIAGLRPGFYTRLGTAVRHVSAELAERPRQRRLLLVISDGKPNDLDHYEGRHGIEDSRMAIQEARRRGQAVFGVIVEAKGQRWFARIFGRGGYALIPQPEKLTTALPAIYRHLVAG